MIHMDLVHHFVGAHTGLRGWRSCIGGALMAALGGGGGGLLELCSSLGNHALGIHHTERVVETDGNNCALGTRNKGTLARAAMCADAHGQSAHGNIQNRNLTAAVGGDDLLAVGRKLNRAHMGAGFKLGHTCMGLEIPDLDCAIHVSRDKIFPAGRNIDTNHGLILVVQREQRPTRGCAPGPDLAVKIPSEHRLFVVREHRTVRGAACAVRAAHHDRCFLVFHVMHSDCAAELGSKHPGRCGVELQRVHKRVCLEPRHWRAGLEAPDAHSALVDTRCASVAACCCKQLIICMRQCGAVAHIVATVHAHCNCAIGKNNTFAIIQRHSTVDSARHNSVCSAFESMAAFVHD
eukprot:comp20576_c0_seq1/m.41767 comp20576_c0_seq1/g.41767  ORF comp20576_c0_seq1/g.41767 comp20576_c0_seq1/m.41767 type:complete len:349 (+) comp20576_c0_seq1:58-1104(+)